MAYTQDDLDALKSILKQGAGRIKFRDKEVEYNSPSEILEAIRMIEAELGTPRRPSRIFANYSKGLD